MSNFSLVLVLGDGDARVYCEQLADKCFAVARGDFNGYGTAGHAAVGEAYRYAARRQCRPCEEAAYILDLFDFCHRHTVRRKNW